MWLVWLLLAIYLIICFIVTLWESGVLQVLLAVGFIFGIFALALHIIKRNNERIQREEEEHLEKLRNFSQKLDPLLSYPASIDVGAAWTLIKKTPVNPESKTDVTRAEALKAARKHKKDIKKSMNEAAVEHEFASALKKAKFLVRLTDSNKYKNFSKLFQAVCDFYKKGTIHIQDYEYGKADKEKIEKVVGKDFGKAILSFSLLPIFLWALTLSEPFDLVRYKAFVTGTGILPTNNGNQCSIDMAASLLYLRHKYGQDYVNNNIGIDWDQMFSSILRCFEAEKLLSLASFAAWAGDFEDEIKLLRELENRRALSADLKTRLNRISSKRVQ